MSSPIVHNYLVLSICNTDEQMNLLSIRNFTHFLAENNIKLIHVPTLEEGVRVIDQDPSLSCLIIDGYYLCSTENNKLSVINIIDSLQEKNVRVPIFLLYNQTKHHGLPLVIISKVHEIINLNEDTPLFISGRIIHAIKKYIEGLLPPYFKALKGFADESPYYWDCPGHQGGVAYLKHPIGRVFIDYFGENIMRADIGIATAELGDWLEHKGPPHESEARAAKIFAADFTYYVTGGSSQSNQIVGHAVMRPQDIVMVDRNCHKSVNHELTITGVRPVYFRPERNGLGIIGLIPQEQFEKVHIDKAILDSPLIQKEYSQTASCAIVTNCTYDGLIYDVNLITRLLADSVPHIQYDEAWYAYAKFHPLYQGRFAMDVPTDWPNLPTLFAVQSTHKMLAAFSSSSMIHVRNSPRAPIDKRIFNESFMMHGTTSPFYPIIASIDVATAMMEGCSGQRLVDEALEDAVSFRKAMRIQANKIKDADQNDWFFGVWQPENIMIEGMLIPFESVPDEILICDPACWTIKPGDPWHGFQVKMDNYGMLDPLKVTVTCPGVDVNGEVSELGIPAAVVCKYLNSQRIIQARNGDYNILFLYALGSTWGKWGTLIEALLEFKWLYGNQVLLKKVLPELVARYPQYAEISLLELCNAIHRKNCQLNIMKLADMACEAEVKPELLPSQAYEYLISNKTENVPIKEINGRLVGVMITPYPPGIPLVMPGERMTASAQPITDYLLALQEFDREFPGFEHELQGVEVDEKGNYWVRCVKESD